MTWSKALTTPHDRLVRRTFARPATAGVLLRRVLPPAFQSVLDLSRIRVSSTSYVDPRLSTRESDLLYTIGLSGSSRSVTVFAALEHQSSPDAMLPLRMLWTLSWLWERTVASSAAPHARIPMALPIAIVQCPSTWNGPNRLSEMFDLPETLRGRLRSPIELELWVDDLRQTVLDDPVAEYDVRALVEVTRALLLGYHEPETLTVERVHALAPLFRAVLERSREDAMALWAYIVRVFEQGSPVDTILLATLDQENRGMCAAMRDTWLAEGRAEGVTRGLAIALLQVLEHRGLSSSETVRQRVLATRDESTLQRWFQRALTVPSIDQVFGRPSGA